ncbi:WhiB family transcriptional regulator [Streptomyces olivaceus]|uniref:WhiB family transcriptional regulator n=1 Tax=Streptomyces olivaceus TaxID=47716 RepID=UPI003557DEBE|nr:WhiB family transcriptional regulator [Streptomyces olivaceus]
MSPNTRLASTPATAAPDWTSAACLHEDPELFFPVGHSPGAIQRVEEAKRVCAGCPLRQACLEWALATNQWSGIWGGATEGERRSLAQGRVDRGRTYELCIQEQEYIERRLSQAATHREIGDELGVGHSAVGRAVRFFKAERAAQAAGRGVAV